MSDRTPVKERRRHKWLKKMSEALADRNSSPPKTQQLRSSAGSPNALPSSLVESSTTLADATTSNLRSQPKSAQSPALRQAHKDLTPTRQESPGLEFEPGQADTDVTSTANAASASRLTSTVDETVKEISRYFHTPYTDLKVNALPSSVHQEISHLDEYSASRSEKTGHVENKAAGAEISDQPDDMDEVDPLKNNQRTGGSEDAQRPAAATTAGIQEAEVKGSLPITVTDTPRSEVLWLKAYNKLKASQDGSEILAAFEISLSPTEVLRTPSQLAAAIEHQLNKREARSWVITLAGKSIKVREQGEKIIKFVMWSSDFITEAVNVEPHAALAWSAVSLILPLLLNNTQQNDAMLAGLDYISNLMPLYRLREDLYLDDTKDCQDLEDAFVDLYMHILRYQGRMIHHFSRKKFLRGAQKLVKLEHWQDWVDSVKEADVKCATFTALVDTKTEKLQWQKQFGIYQKQVHIQEQILMAIEAVSSQQKDLLADANEMSCLRCLASDYRGYKDVNPERVQGTCEWFLDDSRFCEWRDSTTSRLLWVSADPGCGKSVLSKHLVDDRLVSSSLMTSSTCYFFFKDGQAGRTSAANAVAALLHQLFEQNRGLHLVKYALPSFEARGDALRDMFVELWAILNKVVADPDVGEIVCILDALDECDKLSRAAMIRSLVTFYASEGLRTEPSSSRLKFLITSRPYDDIQTSFRSLERNIAFVHFDGQDESEKIGQEINRVIEVKVPDILWQLKPDDRDKIVQHLKSMQNRTYLWLHLIIDEIQTRMAGRGTQKRVEELIRKLPSSVHDAYGAILNRIIPSERDRAMTLLRIVVTAERPLTINEMNVAFSISMKTAGEPCASAEDLDCESNEIFRRDLPNICGLFITIKDESIYLLHQTAREFLLGDEPSSHPGRQVWHHFSSFEANVTLAKTCMRQILFAAFRQKRFTDSWEEESYLSWGKHLDTLKKEHPFLDYSIQYWPQHFRATNSNENDDTFRLARDICDSTSSTFGTWYGLARAQLGVTYAYARANSNTWRWGWVHSKKDRLAWTDLTIATILDFPTVVERILQEGVDVNQLAYGNITALQRASMQGSESITALLLKYDVNVTAGLGDTALMLAIEHDHHKIFDMLLESVADMETQVNHATGCTVLHRAIEYERLEFAKKLLTAGSDSSAKDLDGLSPLIRAVEKNNIAMIGMLQEAGAKLPQTDGIGKSLVWNVASQGNLELLKYLVSCGADPCVANTDDGETPLHAAACHGHLQICRYLLDKGSDVSLANRDGHTALHLAAEYSRIQIMSCLLANGADLCARTKEGLTPLHSACMGTGTAEVLVGAGADIQIKDNASRTPLHWAAAQGEVDLVQHFIKKGALVSALDSLNQSPSHQAYETYKWSLERIAKYRREGSVSISDLAQDSVNMLSIAKFLSAVEEQTTRAMGRVKLFRRFSWPGGEVEHPLRLYSWPRAHGLPEIHTLEATMEMKKGHDVLLKLQKHHEWPCTLHSASPDVVAHLIAELEKELSVGLDERPSRYPVRFLNPSWSHESVVMDTVDQTYPAYLHDGIDEEDD